MKTLAQFKALNKKKGLHWFSKDTIEFWATKIETPLINGRFFITSENDFSGLKRLFTVRQADWETGQVETIGEFQAHLDKFKAKEFLCQYVKENKL